MQEGPAVRARPRGVRIATLAIRIGLWTGIAVAATPAVAQTAAFTNQTGPAGLAASHVPTYGDGFLAGGTVGDFDGDGSQDIFFPGGGGAPDRLFLNDGTGHFTDQSVAWGLTGNHGGTSATAADYDADGDLDLFVNSFQGNRLYQNQGGSFVNVIAAAGVLSASRYGAAFGDHDLDGDLDLAVVDWSSAAQNRLFRNDGDGTFTDVTAASGVGSALSGIVGFTVRFCDMDGDRYPELLWVGDFGTSRYLRNNANGTFSNLTASAGVGFDSNEMGHTVADFDRDGDFDWYITTINTNNLYRNDGNHSYTQIGEVSGVSNTGWGWGTVACDFDHDGRIDIAATSQSSGQFLFRNLGQVGTNPLLFQFWNIGFSSGVSGRGLANLDADADGDQDLVIFPRSGPLQFFRNDLSGPDTHWLRITLGRGAASDIAPHGAGAVITVATGGTTQLGRIDLGANYLSQSEIAAHFGLGAATIADTVTVDWASGTQTVLTDVAVDQTLHIEAEGPPEPEFRRGDANDDGAVDLADAISSLAMLFSGGPPAPCSDAADTNDDGSIDISDAVLVLAHLFSGGVIPAPNGCGVDPTDADALDCATGAGSAHCP